MVLLVPTNVGCIDTGVVVHGGGSGSSDGRGSSGNSGRGGDCVGGLG